MSRINAEKIIAELETAIESFSSDVDLSYVGYVASIADGIAQVRGLEKAKYGECVTFEDGTKGLVLELTTSVAKIVVIGSSEGIFEKSEVKSTGEMLKIGVSDDILGRIVDPFGNPLDNITTDIVADKYMPLENNAPGILDRKSIHQSCPTGVKIIDAFLPIGKGQREMIIGDRLTGKTSIALDMIINQKSLRDRGEKIQCIYVAVGQKASKIAKLKQELIEKGAMEYTTIVSTTADDPAILQVLAPFAGCAIGEYFRDKGEHAIVIYDDLSTQAVAHRQVSLLLRQPPGREAYPGDVFYLHSRLLERAAKLKDELGGGSLTAIPIIETQEGNYATYVATNVWSITDGQIVLKTDLFLEGQKPAIDIGLSVSRVGRAAQIAAMKPSMELKLTLAKYNEYKSFSKYGAELDETTQIIIDTGDKLMEILKQRNGNPVDEVQQSILFQACLKGHINVLTLDQIKEFENKLYEQLKTEYADIYNEVAESQKIDSNLENKINHMVQKITTEIAQQ